VRARIDSLPAATRDALAVSAAIGPARGGRARTRPASIWNALDEAPHHSCRRLGGRGRFGSATRCSRRWSTRSSDQPGVRGGARANRASRRRGRSSAPPATLALAAPPRPMRTSPETLDDAGHDRPAIAERQAVAAELAEQPRSGSRPQHRRAQPPGARRRACRGGRPASRRGLGRSSRTSSPSPASARSAPRPSSCSRISRASIAPADLLQTALEAAPTPALRAAILTRLAFAIRFRTGFAHAAEYGRAALSLLRGPRRRPPDRRRARRPLPISPRSRAKRTGPDSRRGGAGGRPQRTAIRCSSGLPGSRSPPNVCLERRVDEARAIFERAYENGATRDELVAAVALWQLGWVELWAGRWERGAGRRRPGARAQGAVRARAAA